MRLASKMVGVLTMLAVGAPTTVTVGCSSDAARQSSTRTDATDRDGGASDSGCVGFPLVGLRYSPGGNVLPDRCKPFDPTTNNPYAVRCIDAMPDFATRYPGDGFCILPPPPDRGLQVGVHPQGASYWDELWAGDLGGYSNDALTRDFEVAPGGEIEQTYAARMTNDARRFYYRLDSRMRVGSHHMATYFASNPGTEGWRPVDHAINPAGADGGFFWNSQRTNTDRPAGSLDIPEEDQGLGMPIEPAQGLLFDLHHFNTRDLPILREAWINIWWVDEPVSGAVADKPLVAPVNVPPDSLTDLDGSFAPSETTRVLSLFGHRHAWTRRLNAWVHRESGDDEPVYDSFDWLDVPTYSYDSASKNPVADARTSRDGASSGVLTVNPGDELRFTCHVDTTQRRASEIGVPMPKDTLTFGNEAFGAEMCILYAQTVVRK